MFGLVVRFYTRLNYSKQHLTSSIFGCCFLVNERISTWKPDPAEARGVRLINILQRNAFLRNTWREWKESNPQLVVWSHPCCRYTTLPGGEGGIRTPDP